MLSHALIVDHEDGGVTPALVENSQALPGRRENSLLNGAVREALQEDFEPEAITAGRLGQGS